MPDSTAYEKFVQELHQDLLRQTALKNVNVQHNVKLKGKSGTPYQVDVYWEFELAGTTYRTCIECKEYNRKVNRNAVNAFSSWLDDLGNANGIFVTTAGYQSGAKKFAASRRNIRLLVINPIIKSVHVTMNIEIPDFTLSEPLVDVEGVKRLMADKGLASWSWNLQADRHTVLLDVEGAPAIGLNALVNREIKKDGEHVLALNGYYLPCEIGLMPLVQIKVVRRTSYVEEKMLFNLGNGAKAIIEDVLAHTAEYVNEDGTISPAPKAK